MMTDVKRAGPIRTVGVLAAVTLLAFAACEAPAPTATQPSSDSEVAAAAAKAVVAPVVAGGTVVMDREAQGAEPLVYLDGIRIDRAEGSNPLDAVDPDEIESIEIIKGGAAEALYGGEASGGVIQIVTKAHAAADGSR